jgi:hypothetical protein
LVWIFLRQFFWSEYLHSKILIWIFPRQYFDLNIFTPYFGLNIFTPIFWSETIQAKRLIWTFFNPTVWIFFFPLAVCFAINVTNSYFRH